MEAVNINDYKNHKLEESEVIKRILDGERELFEILVRRNNQKLYRVIRSYLKDEPEVEDVMQNSYVKAYTKLYQFKIESSFATWLIRIGINEALARLREKDKLRRISQLADNSRQNNIIQIPDNRQKNPQQKMINNETKRLLENAIDQLDSKYRAVYVMKEIEGLSLKEIAEAMDITVANVKVRVHRSKEMLKEMLYEEVNDKNVFEFGFSRCDRITERVMDAIGE